MLITADYKITPACQGAGKKFIIIRIVTNALRKRGSGIDGGILDHKLNYRFKMNGWMLPGKGYSHTLILRQNFWRNDKLNDPIPPGLENLEGRPIEKDSRD